MINYQENIWEQLMGSTIGISAGERKTSASKKFSAGRYEDAKKGYYRALETLQFGSRDMPEEEKNEMRGALFSNIAACLINQAHSPLNELHREEDQQAELLSALVCADHAIALRPHWDRGYQRRADILHYLGRERASKAARRKYAQLKQGIIPLNEEDEHPSTATAHHTATTLAPCCSLTQVQEVTVRNAVGCWDLWRTSWARRYHINVESFALDGPEAVGFFAFLHNWKAVGCRWSTTEEENNNNDHHSSSTTSSSFFPVSLVLSFYKAIQLRHWADDFHGNQVLPLRLITTTAPKATVATSSSEKEQTNTHDGDDGGTEKTEAAMNEVNLQKDSGKDNAPTDSPYTFTKRTSANTMRLGRLKTLPESYINSAHPETMSEIIRGLLLGQHIDAFAALLTQDPSKWAYAKSGVRDPLLQTIHIAARSGSTSFVRLLLERYNCDVNLCSQDFGPPLAFALSEDPVKGNYRIVGGNETSLAVTNKFETPTEPCNKLEGEEGEKDSSPTFLQLMRGEKNSSHKPDLEMISLLLSLPNFGANPALEFKDMDTIYGNELDDIPDDVLDEEKTTILHKILTFPHAKPLFDHAVKGCGRFKNHSLSSFPFYGDLKLGKIMTEDDRVFPLLFSPVRAARLENVKCLVEQYNLNVNTTDAWGNTPLHVAGSMLDHPTTSRGYDYFSDLKEVVLYLLSKGADPLLANRGSKLPKLDRFLE